MTLSNAAGGRAETGAHAHSVLESLSPHPVMLAPMVGLSHFAVRAALAEFLPVGARALWPTEMLNSRRIPQQKENQTPEVTFRDKDNGLIPQILGNEEEPIRRSMKILEEWGARAVDINMGCPVQKALKHNYGVALMGDPKYAAEVTSMAVRNTTLPVSVKLRAGLGEENIAGGEHGTRSTGGVHGARSAGAADEHFLIDFVEGILDAGASWITLHPRTAAQKRRGSANWNLIYSLKKRFNQPIIGNGDIQCWEDVVEMKESTGCDRVMIGRALMAKPWLMSVSSAEVGGNFVEPDPVEQGELYGKFLKRVLDYSEMHYEESAGMRRMRFLVVQGKPWVVFGEYLYGRLHAAKTYAEMRAALELFFSQPQKIVRRSELRT